MTDGVRVRNARIDDAATIAALSTALGYPADAAAMRERLERLLTHEDAIVFVAESGGAAIGWLHAAERDLLESGPRCEILGLVVDSSHRRHGAGRLLVDAAEHWATARGLPHIAVRSNVVRTDSHPFYERLGYERVKTQHAYRKALTADPPRGR